MYLLYIVHKCALELGSFSIYEQPKWESIVASTQVGVRVSIWVRIRIRVRVRVRVRLGLYFGCSYIEKGPRAPCSFYQDELHAHFICCESEHRISEVPKYLDIHKYSQSSIGLPDGHAVRIKQNVGHVDN